MCFHSTKQTMPFIYHPLHTKLSKLQTSHANRWVHNRRKFPLLTPQTLSGVVAIWKKRGRVPFVAAVDGSVFIKHSTFANKMRETLVLMGCNNVSLEIATDGSGLGSALIAATA